MNKASLAKFTPAIWWGRLGSCLPKSRVNLSVMLRGEDLKAKRRIRLRQRQKDPSLQCHRRSPRYYSRDLVGQVPQGAERPLTLPYQRSLILSRSQMTNYFKGGWPPSSSLREAILLTLQPTYNSISFSSDCLRKRQEMQFWPGMRELSLQGHRTSGNSFCDLKRKGEGTCFFFWAQAYILWGFYARNYSSQLGTMRGHVWGQRPPQSGWKRGEWKESSPWGCLWALNEPTRRVPHLPTFCFMS